MEHNIVILDSHVANPGNISWEAYEKLGNLTVYDRSTPDQIVERAKDADIIIVNKLEITSEMIAALPKLKYIGLFATGFNNIDLDAARNAGITVCNVPAYATGAVAQTIFAHLLNITDHIADYAEAVRAGRWQNCNDFSFSLGFARELDGLTMGIYGLGNIGLRVARIAAAFGMKVVSPTNRAQNTLPAYIEKVDFDTFLHRSDVISVSAPLMPDNRGIFNAANFAKMKRGVIFINTARGPLVDEAALADALKSGQVGAAGLDVMCQEPPRNGSPLLDAPNCFISPHIAWESDVAQRELLDVTAANIAAYLSGHPQNVVD